MIIASCLFWSWHFWALLFALSLHSRGVFGVFVGGFRRVYIGYIYALFVLLPTSANILRPHEKRGIAWLLKEGWLEDLEDFHCWEINKSYCIPGVFPGI